MQEIGGNILFCLLVFCLFYPMGRFFKNTNKNKIEGNLKEFDKKKAKKDELFSTHKKK